MPFLYRMVSGTLSLHKPPPHITRRDTPAMNRGDQTGSCSRKVCCMQFRVWVDSTLRIGGSRPAGEGSKQTRANKDLSTKPVLPKKKKLQLQMYAAREGRKKCRGFARVEKSGWGVRFTSIVS